MELNDSAFSLFVLENRRIGEDDDELFGLLGLLGWGLLNRTERMALSHVNF